MKKFTVSLVAVLMLLVCVLTMTAPAAKAAETTDPIIYHCLCGNKHSTAFVRKATTRYAGGLKRVLLMG